MFVRVKRATYGGTTHEYLQIVESVRRDGQVRQRVIGTLGRRDELVGDGSLDAVVESLAKHSEALTVVNALREGDVALRRDLSWGPVLVFERLWERLGLRDLFERLGATREFGFSVERCAFAMALQRLCPGPRGSDLAGWKWVHTLFAPSLWGMELQYFYRTAGFLAEHKDAIEEHLYQRGRPGLFDFEVDLVFFDTTTAYFEGAGPRRLAKRGKSKDHRYHDTQLVIGMAIARQGLPILCEVWPGNTGDVKTLRPVVERLRRRFKIGRLILVCDAGMVSKKNLRRLDAMGIPYIVGTKLRGDAEVRDQVIGCPGRYRHVAENLWVKQVQVGPRRYVLCFNPEEAERDRKAREGILEALERKLDQHGPKGLVVNRGYKRFLATPARDALTIDWRAVQTDRRYDGKYVLRTTTDLPADEVAVAYKSLWTLEQMWRALKDGLRVRPIFHHKADNVRGHVVGCFLGLYLASTLRLLLPPDERRTIPWADLMRDVEGVRATRLELRGVPYRVRSDLTGYAGVALRAAGVRPPPTVERWPDGVGMPVVPRSPGASLST